MKIDLRILFFGSGTKYLNGSFIVPASPLQFLQGPAGHAKVPAEVPGDSKVLRVRLVWFPTFDHLATLLIPFKTVWFGLWTISRVNHCPTQLAPVSPLQVLTYAL